MLNRLSPLAVFCGVSLTLTLNAQDVSEATAPYQPAVQRAHGTLVITLKQSPSVVDLCKHFKVDKRKQLEAQEKAEKLQLARNRKFHEAAGLGTGAHPLRGYCDHTVKLQFGLAKALLEHGVDINWGHPLLNLFRAFKEREEEQYRETVYPCASFPYSGHSTTRVPSGFGRARNATIFGEGHEFVKWLIEKGAHVNDVWKEDDTARFKHYEMGSIEEYECTSDVRHKTSNHYTPLKYALELCKQGCCVKALLEAHAQPYPRALYDALHNNPLVARLLVQKGASVVEIDDKGNNAIFWALNAQLKEEERIALLDVLHAAKADFHLVNALKQTPLHGAVVNNDLHGTLREDVTSLAWLLRHDPLIDAQDAQGNTALHLAVSHPSAFYQKSFQEASTYPYSHGSRPQHEIRALFWKNDPKQLFEQNSKIVKVLLEGGANPALITEGGLTALHIAAGRGMADCMALLLQHHSTQVNAQDEKLLTPLHHVIMADIPLAEKTVIVQQLQEAGANFELADREGNTALHKAAQSIDADAVDLLLAFGAKPEPRNLLNHTPQEAPDMIVKHSFKKAHQKRIKKALKAYAAGTLIPHVEPAQKEENVTDKEVL